MHFNMADIGAFHCHKAEFIIIIIIINSSFKTGTGSRYTGCITRPLSHSRKLISCQLAIFLPLKSLVRMGPLSFAVSGPTLGLWNSLPLELKTMQIPLESFKSKLKTHLFTKAYDQ